MEIEHEEEEQSRSSSSPSTLPWNNTSSDSSQKQEQSQQEQQDHQPNEQLIMELQVIDEQENDETKIYKKIKQRQLLQRRIKKKLEKAQGKHQPLLNSNKQQISTISVKSNQPQQCLAISPFIKFLLPTEDCFVFGEMMLEGDFKKDAFNLEKTYNWSYFKRGDQVKYVKDMDCIVVELRRGVKTESNFECAIQKYLHTPDQQMHKLGVYLKEYYNKISHFLQIAEEQHIFKDPAFVDKLLANSKKYYERCIDWVKRNTVPEDAYYFQYYELDFTTMDQNYKNQGFSSLFLDILGLNKTTATSFIMRRGRLEYIDGLSRLFRLIFRLELILNNGWTNCCFSLDHDIITVDGFTIPVKCKVFSPDFSFETAQDSEHYQKLFGEFQSQFAVFRLFKFEINPNILKHLKEARQEAASKQNAEGKDSELEYSAMSEIFMDKFYPKTQPFSIVQTLKKEGVVEEDETIKESS